MWSLGVVIYTMLVGKPPFETNDVKTTYKKIRMNSYSFPDNVPISVEARALVTRILHLNPSFRPSLDEVLSHAYFNQGNTIPKLLPTSTLACAPSNLILNGLNSAKDLEVTGSVNIDKPYRNDSKDLLNQANIDTLKINANTERIMRKDDNNNINKNNDFNNRPNTMRQEKDLGDNLNLNSNMNNLNTNNLKTVEPTGNSDKGMRTLAVSVYNPNLLDQNGGEAVNKGPDVWVQKWVDYSTKYGLG